MESNEQSITNSDPRHYPVWKYIWNIIAGGLLLLLFEYLFLEYFYYIPRTMEYWDWQLTDFSFINIGFIVVNILVAVSIIFIPAWSETKSLKTVTLALGSCFLSILLLPLPIYISTKFNRQPPGNYPINDVYAVIVPEIAQLILILSCLSLILSVIGLVWIKIDYRKGNLLDPKAGDAKRLSQLALVASVLNIISQCGILIFIQLPLM
jgi:hypothetical protein